MPCYNEELVLRANTSKVLNYADRELSDFDWKVLILDNASGDKTYSIAVTMSQENLKIIVDQCVNKGRGAALSMAWTKHVSYDIYSYMDMDLATDIKDFKNILTKVSEGYNIVVGSRYVAGADIERSFKREFLSRIYNLLLKIFFSVKFKDAQCGFKAFDARVVSEVLSNVRDAGWFWDTEFMILAERKGYKIFELPVRWREVVDELRKSKVSPFVEILRQLKNIVQLRRRL